jgi:hypothetical protein
MYTIMDKLAFAAVSRNHFNMPVWAGVHAGLFTTEGLDLSIGLHEPIDGCATDGSSLPSA